MSRTGERARGFGGRSWFEVRNAAGAGAPEVLIYEEIGAFGVDAKSFVDAVNGLGDVTELVVRINSPGGDAFAGITIYNMLKRHPARVTVWVDGLAASAASVIAMAGDTIVMPENTMMMVHQPFGAGAGTADDMRKMGDALERVTAALVATYQAKTGLSRDQLMEILEAETWLSAQEAVDLGFADQVAEATRIAALFDLSRYVHPPRQLAGETEPGDAPAGLVPGAVDAAKAAEVRAAAAAEGKAEGVAAERARILEIWAMARADEKDLAQACIDEGVTPKEFAVRARLKEKAAVSRMQSIGPLPAVPRTESSALPTGSTITINTKQKETDTMSMIDPKDPMAAELATKSAEEEWAASADTRAEFGGRKDEFLAFKKAECMGRMKLYNGGRG